MKKRLWYLVLYALLLSTLMPAPALAATTHPVGSAEELSALLSGSALQSGDTIKLTADIGYTSPIVINGKDITFDVGEYTLTIANTEKKDGIALEVGPGGTVRLKATTGALNIVASSRYGNGVYAYDGGMATVTNVTVDTEYCWAAYAEDPNSVVNITGDVVCTASYSARGLCAFNGGKVNVGDDVQVTGGGSYGIMCGSRGAVHIGGSLQVQGKESCGILFEAPIDTDQVDGTVRVDGGIAVGGESSRGIFASDPDNENEFVVTGNISVSGKGSVGLQAISYAKVKVNGDITATGMDSIGAAATEDGVTTVNGTISAPLYVGVNVTSGGTLITKTKEEGVPGTGAYANYLVYRDTAPPAGSLGTGTVYVWQGGGGSKPSGKDPRTLTDSVTGIIVSGGGIRGGTQLIVQPLSLHEPGQCAACDAILQYMADSDMTVLFSADLSLSRSHSGELTITIPVGTQYNGQTLTLLHCYNGELETLTAVVTDGKAVFTVRGLSPVALVANAKDAAAAAKALDNIPITDDRGSALVWWLLCGASAAGMVILIGLHRRRLSRQ